MSNVVDMRAYRTLRECQKLFVGYEAKLKDMDKATLLAEFERYRVESARYPTHLLTIVKGEILLRVMKRRPITMELRQFVEAECQRLDDEIQKRVHPNEQA